MAKAGDTVWLVWETIPVINECGDEVSQVRRLRCVCADYPAARVREDDEEEITAEVLK
jgi:hypothetical protein